MFDNSQRDELQDLMETEYQRLSEKTPAEMTESFRQAYSALLISNKNKPFLNWLLLHTPINLLPCSTHATAMATTDGNVYVNPVFWSAIVKSHAKTEELVGLDDKGGKMADLNYLIAHEVGHLMLRHPWSVRRTIESAPPEKRESLHYIANLCVDFVVNAGFCAPLLPNATFLQRNGVTDNHSFQSFMEKAIGPLPDKIQEMLGEPDLALWGWDDIYHVIVNNLSEENMEKMRQHGAASIALDLGERDEESLGCNGLGSNAGSGAGATNNKDNGEHTGTHGEKVPAGAKVLRIREGGAGGPETEQEARWKRMAAEAVAEARSMGTEARSVARLFESEFEVRVPWESLVRDRLASYLGQSQVRQTWMRDSRKHHGLPGSVRIGGKNLWLLADVSGSIRDAELDAMAGISLSFLKRTGGTLRVVFWDTDVRGDHVVRAKGDMKRITSIDGGGGTVIGPALKHLLKNGERNDRVCVCTDSAIADIGNPETASDLKNVCARFGSVIWFHFGDKNELAEALAGTGGKITPVVVDTRSRLVDRLMPGASKARLV